jgi:hypothetical protein
MNSTLRLALLGGLAAGLGTLPPAWAQPASPQGGAPAAAPSPATREGAAPAAREGAAGERAERRSAIVEPSALEPGANSFTEGQARARLEEAGFTNLQELNLDNQGFWRARANQGGSTTDVALDFRGRIASGQGLANLGAGTRSGGEAERGTAAGNARDGAPGNPPSTMTGRAADRAQGETPRPDGTPGNPPGTAAGRALDRATGSNATGTDATPQGSTGGGTNR